MLQQSLFIQNTRDRHNQAYFIFGLTVIGFLIVKRTPMFDKMAIGHNPNRTAFMFRGNGKLRLKENTGLKAIGRKTNVKKTDTTDIEKQGNPAKSKSQTARFLCHKLIAGVSNSKTFKVQQ